MKAKVKKCVVCGSEFMPFRSTQRVCSSTCAVSFGKSKVKKQNAKLWAVEKKQRKESLKTHKDWLNDLQKVFNAFIRERDKGQPCISCGTTAKVQIDAGHYRAVGSHPELRFEEKNTNSQCRKCNGYWGGNLIEYRKGLIKKYGLEVVEWLEGPHESKKLSIPEIKEKITYYKKKIKEFK